MPWPTEMAMTAEASGGSSQRARTIEGSRPSMGLAVEAGGLDGEHKLGSGKGHAFVDPSGSLCSPPCRPRCGPTWSR